MINSNNILNICFCTNDSYAEYLPTVVESILRNCSCQCQFFIVYSSINQRDIDALNKLIALRPEYAITFIQADARNLFAKYLPANSLKLKPFRGGFDAYTRLFLPEILSRYGVNKVLYLDIDMVVIRNLDAILSLMQRDFILQGVLDTVSLNLPYKFLTPDYINSGMLLMNLSKLSEINFTQDCVNFILKYGDQLDCCDQDTINQVLTGKLILIDQKFNQYLHSKQDIESAVILHFTGPGKPWMSTTGWRLKKCYYYAYVIAAKHSIKGKPLSKQSMHYLIQILKFSRSLLNIYHAIGKLKRS